MRDLIKKILKEEIDKNQHLYDTTDERFKSYIGKRVCVKTNTYRDNQGKLKPSSKGNEICGVLKFAGVNPAHGEFQATIDNLPLYPINPKNITLE